jgi:hypothetical protein
MSGLLNVKVSALEIVARVMSAKEVRAIFIEDSVRVKEGFIEKL